MAVTALAAGGRHLNLIKFVQPSSFPAFTSCSSFPSQLLPSKIPASSRIMSQSQVSLASTPPASPPNSQFPENVGESLGDVAIFKATGEPIAFKDLWDQTDGLAVVALLRHFGCICCWELASVLKEAKPRFDSAGVKLVAVGVGTPDKARMLAERLPFPTECLFADPERKAYDLLGLYRGFGRTFFSGPIVKAFSRRDSIKEKAGKNYTLKASPSDISGVLQQGGMFVFKGKQLLYARKDEGTGDHAPLDDVFEVCCKVPVA